MAWLHSVLAFTLVFSVFGLGCHLYPVICSRGPYLPLQKLLTSILCYLLLLPKGVRHVHFRVAFTWRCHSMYKLLKKYYDNCSIIIM